MPKGERRITELFTKTDKHYILGEETNIGRVASISFRKDIHKTTGHSGMPCYVVAYYNNTVQTVVPYQLMVEYTTDIDRQVDEDVGHVPELPEQEGD